MEKYSPGDKVMIQDFYISHYGEWGKKMIGKEAIVLFAKSFPVYAPNIGKDERPIYQAKYGILAEYTLWELHIELEGRRYIVSQLGFSK
jgi:hypothetical protein